jgi:hypothetical protein
MPPPAPAVAAGLQPQLRARMHLKEGCEEHKFSKLPSLWWKLFQAARVDAICAEMLSTQQVLAQY